MGLQEDSRLRPKKSDTYGGMWEIPDEEVKRIKTGERRNDDA